MKLTTQLRILVKFNKIRNFSITLIFLSCCFLSSLTAQQFCSYTGVNNALDESKSIVKTFDGGYAIAGKSDSAFLKRALLYKFDALGNLSWTKIFRSTYACEAFSVVQTNDSALLVVGQATTSSALNGIEIFIAKVKQNGTLLFQKKLGNFPLASDEAAFAACSTPDGGAVLLCQTNKNVNSAIDLMLLKIGANGNIVWERDLIDAYYAEVPVAIKRDAPGNFLIAGYMSPVVTSNPMYYELFLAKLDSSGSLKWAKSVGGTNFDQANDLLILNNDAGYVLCGRTESYVPATASSAAYLTVMDTSGTIKWARTFNTSGFNLVEFNGLAADNQNNILACGTIQSYNNNDVALLVKYNGSTGKVMWNKVYEDYQNASASFRSITNTGSGYALCGKTNRFNFSDNLILTAVDTNGNSCCISDSLPAYVIDSGFASANWVLFDTLSTDIVTNGNIVQTHSAGITFDYCVSVGMNQLEKVSNIPVYPNPGNGNFEFVLPEEYRAQCQVIVYNSIGKRIKYEHIPLNGGRINLNLSPNLPGVYLVQFQMDNKLLQTHCVVVKE